MSRSTLADANENRDWRIYADFARVLIAETRGLYADEDFGIELDNTVHALDAGTIDLCLSLFPWARFRKTKGAVKTPIWIAVCVYLLVAIVKKQHTGPSGCEKGGHRMVNHDTVLGFRVTGTAML